jgi:hypothetical protein
MKSALHGSRHCCLVSAFLSAPDEHGTDGGTVFVRVVLIEAFS